MKYKIPSLIKPSTAAFTREARQTPGYRFFDWVHGMVYARWPYLYISIGVGEHPIAQGIKRIQGFVSKLSPKHDHHHSTSNQSTNGKITFADTYHGKVVPLQQASQLVLVHEDVRIENLEHVIPYKKARDIILRQPDHIVALQCPCRTARQTPCLPLDVCLIVGEPFASFVMEHHPERAKWISQERAIQILREEDERGHVHHAFFKDAMLGRFYAICNCCACCCGAMQAQRNGTPMLASSGYLAQIDDQLCIGCAQCHAYCQFSALSLAGYITQVDKNHCMGCGICLSKCDQAAISLVRNGQRSEPLELFDLIATVQN